MRKVLGVLFFVLVVVLAACSNESNVSKDSVPIESIIDANQFSRITSTQLVELMGEPEKTEDYEWLVPKTNKSIVGKLFTYEKGKYEFIIFDDQVVRLDVNSGQFWGYDDSVLTFNQEDDIFKMFNITPNEHLKKIADTNYALRFSPVSDKVADVWVIEIDGKNFGSARITYNLNYF